MTSRDSLRVDSRAQNPSKSPKNDQRSVFLTKNTQKSQKSTPDAAPETKKPKITQNLAKDSRIALVCDWLTTPGGAEKVLLELRQMYPNAPIYTSQYSKKGIDWFNDADVRTGWLQIFPKSLRKFLGPLRQLYFSHLDLSDYDLVISVTGAEAKSVRTRPKLKKTQTDSPLKKATHLCYCHVPTQYYWQMYDKYVENPGFGPLNPLVRLVFKLLVKPLRQADYCAAQRPDQFITISSYAQAQIQQYYHRDSVVIAPPAEVTKFTRQGSTFPPETHQNSTKSPDFSTPFPQHGHKKSTASGELSTNSSELSTRNPQEIHKKPDTFPPKSTTSPQVIHNKTGNYPQNTTTFPPLFHKKSTENHNFSTTFPQDTSNHRQTDPNSTLKSDYFIISCRQVTWKRVDLAIAACKTLQLPLKVVGSGPEHKRLVKLAQNCPNIEFIPWVDTVKLATLLQHATAYIFPSLEPFGIAAVEALAAGCPVIAYREGGSQDFIQEGKNGLFFDQQTPASLIKALHSFYNYDFDPILIAETAQQFGPSRFRQQIQSLVADSLYDAVNSPITHDQTHTHPPSSGHLKHTMKPEHRSQTSASKPHHIKNQSRKEQNETSS